MGLKSWSCSLSGKGRHADHDDRRAGQGGRGVPRLRPADQVPARRLVGGGRHPDKARSGRQLQGRHGVRPLRLPGRGPATRPGVPSGAVAIAPKEDSMSAEDLTFPETTPEQEDALDGIFSEIADNCWAVTLENGGEELARAIAHAK